PDLVVGDLRKQSFKEIWEESPVMISLRDRSDLQGRCATCEYKALCGGCRARAYAYFGDLKGADPGCIFNREYYYEFMRANHRKHKTLEREVVKQQVV
ncbi:MAG: SPASM domain-containing protein, partial [candidate division WOR-3 bacterium]|nr:SPASM domain-containing protein [candidate division WOR-3 bacterium]